MNKIIELSYVLEVSYQHLTLRRKLLSKNYCPNKLLLFVYSIFHILWQKYPYFKNRLTIIEMYKM